MDHSTLIDDALAFAAQAHRDQVRKGTNTPYIIHPVGVMLILQRAGENDPELLAAALLHDTMEDSGITEDDLRRAFGPRVAAIVAGATEPFARDDPWEMRKEHTVAYMRSAPREVKLVAAADKLHNLSAMMREHAELGDALWQRFNRGRPEIAWYYRAVTDSLQAGELRQHPLLRQLDAYVSQFFGAD